MARISRSDELARLATEGKGSAQSRDLSFAKIPSAVKSLICRL